MFQPNPPVKFSKEQLDMLANQTIICKELFASTEKSLVMLKTFAEMNPFIEHTNFIEHLDNFIEQVGINKNYFAMTETYLGLVKGNVDLWHNWFIDTDKTKKKK